jgi:hypothetical protein
LLNKPIGDNSPKNKQIKEQNEKGDSYDHVPCIPRPIKTLDYIVRSANVLFRHQESPCWISDPL